MELDATTPRSGEAGPRKLGERRDPWLWAILALGLAPRLWLLTAYPHARGFGDETAHYANGVLVSHLGTGLIGHWAPAYDSMLGAIFWVAGPDPAWPRGVQVGLSVLTVWLVYRLAYTASGRGAARIAGSLAALDPTFIAYTQFYLTETLYTTVLVAAVYVVHRRPEGPERLDLLGAGLLFGVSALTRSLVLWFFPVWIAWEWASGRRDRAVHAAVILGVAAAVVLPWTLRNASKYRDFLLVDATLGRTAYLSYSETEGATPPGRDLGYDRGLQERDRPECDTPDVPWLEPLPPAAELMELFPRTGLRIAVNDRRFAKKLEQTRRRAILDLPSRQRCELANAAAYATAHPAFVARLFGSNFYAFWGPNSFLLRAVHEGLYKRGPLVRASYPILKPIVIASTVGVVVAALLALGRRPWHPVTRWSVLFTAFYTAIHMASIGHSRYRLPIMALLIVLAAGWLSRPTRPAASVAAAAVVAAVAGYLVLSIHYVVAVLP